MSKEEIIVEKQQNPTFKAVFKNNDFLKLWVGQFISNTGSNITLIVLPLFIFQYTGSTFWLGIITLAQFIPILIFSPIAGMFVDSHNRKTIMISSDILRTVFISLVPLLIIFDNQFSQLFIVSGITLIVFIQGVVSRFFMPARMATIPRVVKPNEIGLAVSISQTTYQLIAVLGPVLGAAIATILGYKFAFLIDGLTFLFSAIMVSFIKTDLNPLHAPNAPEEKPSILLGTKKLFQISSLRFLIIIFSFVIFTNAALNSFLVAFCKGDLRMTNVQFGTTLTIFGGSGVVTGIILSKKISQFKRPVLLVILSILLSGIALLPIIIVSQYWQLYVMFFFLGSFDLTINIPFNTIFLRDTTDNIRGQAFSALNMVVSLFNVLGIFYGVVFAPIIGIRDLYFINAVIFVIMGVIALGYMVFINDFDNKKRPNKFVS